MLSLASSVVALLGTAAVRCKISENVYRDGGRTMAKKTAKRTVKKVTDQVVQANEQGARQAILEDLFYDFIARADKCTG